MVIILLLMMRLLYGIAVNGWYLGSKPQRDFQYLRFIRTLPCTICSRCRYIEAAHFGPRGLGQKANDMQTLPLCSAHHRTGVDSYHSLGPRKFAEHHRLNVNRLIGQLNELFELKFGANS